MKPVIKIWIVWGELIGREIKLLLIFAGEASEAIRSSDVEEQQDCMWNAYGDLGDCRARGCCNYSVVEEAVSAARPKIKWPGHLSGSCFHSNPVGALGRRNTGAESDCLSSLYLAPSVSPYTHTCKQYGNQLMSVSDATKVSQNSIIHHIWDISYNLHLYCFSLIPISRVVLSLSASLLWLFWIW